MVKIYLFELNIFDGGCNVLYFDGIIIVMVSCINEVIRNFY